MNIDTWMHIWHSHMKDIPKNQLCLKHCTGNKFTQKALVVKLNSRHLGLAEGEVGLIFVVVHDVCESLV